MKKRNGPATIAALLFGAALVVALATWIAWLSRYL